jgi:transcriptional regulator with XRE-family HTH domain
MRSTLMVLGEKLRQRRELLRLHQSQLAAMADVSVRTIQLVEQAKTSPSLDTLIRLADVLGLEIDLLLKDPSKSANV